MKRGGTWVVGLALLLAAEGLSAAEPLDVAVVRSEASPKVCLVTADGPLGLPVAYASGFLFGGGKFVITDLASVARPGVEKVTVRFRDGSTAVGRQFAMADPAIGLAAIVLDQPKTETGGLGLSAALPADGSEAAIVGWKRAQDIDILKGAVRGGVAAADLATLAKVQAPSAGAPFLAFTVNRVDLATGAPAIDASGQVIGVFLDVAGVDRTILVPAAMVRAALLASGAQIKPLSGLPKPVWPVAVSALAGKPVTPGELAQTVRAAKARSRCQECNGRGVVVRRKHVGTDRTAVGTVRNIYKDVQEPCRACGGGGVVCSDGLYVNFAAIAYGAAWLAASPDAEPKARDAALTSATAMLAGLGKVGARFRDVFVSQAGADIGKVGGEFPRGVVVYAQVRETVAAPDGPYAVLSPFRSPVTLAVKMDLLTPPAGPEGRPAGAAPAVGRWIVLGGAAEGVALLQGQKPILVRPFGWAPGPALGRVPFGPGPGPGPVPDDTPQPRPPKDPSEPNFFGL